MLYKSFCDTISTSVENSILSWHGRNNITLIQALKLIQNGYMLGGFIVDVGCIIMPVLTGVLSVPIGRQRFFGNELKRDYDALCKFYQLYKLDFDACKNVDELNYLQSHVVKDLYEQSMAAIRLTCEFGG